MNLAVDIGNTRTKTAVFQGHTILDVYVIQNSELVYELQKIVRDKTIRHLVMSSVSEKEVAITEAFEDIIPVFVVSSSVKLPFTNLYATPKTLGVDRIALAAAAVSKFPNQDCLIIDAGTCITFDFVNGKKEYLGGAIAPGLHMRYHALHQFTAKLPRLAVQAPKNFIGDSTEESIHSGIVNGLTQEIEGVIQQYKKDYPDLTVVLTGGDSNFLSKQLKSSIFATQNFLLIGLNEILILNHNL